MKYLPSILAIGLLALVIHAQTPAPSSTPSPAAKPAGDPFVKNPGDTGGKAEQQQQKESPDLVIVFEAYSLNRNDAAPLLEAESASAARYRRVLDLEKGGKAHLQTLTALGSKSGQRAVVEAIDEVRYATGFTSWIGGNVMPTPIQWETRNAGDTFEIEPVLGPDEKICDLNFVPTRVTLAGYRDEEGVTGDPATSQPIFLEQRITTSVSVNVGEPCYIGTFTPPPVVAAKGGASAEVWLAFVHVTTRKLSPIDLKAAIPNGPLMTSLIYSCYSLDRSTARDILVTPSSAAAPWEKVQALLAEKKAQLEFMSSARTKSGQRELVEETQEIRFMTEYAPPSLTNTSETGTTVNSKGESSNTTFNHTPANAQRIPGYGSTFETRKTGITVEFEPVIREDAKRVDINQVIQSVNFPGMLKVPGVGAHYQPQPLFQTSKVTTTQTVLAGQPTLVSTLNPPSADGVNDRADTGRAWLLFVRAAIDEP
jgi:hypothetical protein